MLEASRMPDDTTRDNSSDDVMDSDSDDNLLELDDALLPTDDNDLSLSTCFLIAFVVASIMLEIGIKTFIWHLTSSRGVWTRL
jgi:hypothetical protein